NADPTPQGVRLRILAISDAGWRKLQRGSVGIALGDGDQAKRASGSGHGLESLRLRADAGNAGALAIEPAHQHDGRRRALARFDGRSLDDRALAAEAYVHVLSRRDCLHGAEGGEEQSCREADHTRYWMTPIRPPDRTPPDATLTAMTTLISRKS